MRFIKIKSKKLLAVILSVCIVLSVVITGAIIGVSADMDNYLANGSFEMSTSRGNGFGLKVPNGQKYTLTDGWRGFTWADRNYFVSHASDAYSGSYAMRFDLKGGTPTTLNFYPNKADVAQASMGSGYYTLSFMAKGTNTSSYVEMKLKDGRSYKVQIPASSMWQKVEIPDIYIASANEVFESYADDTGVHIITSLVTEASGDTFVCIDDFRLAKTENLLSNGSLERVEGIWQTSAGYTDRVTPHGQNNNMAASEWGAFNYWHVNTDNSRAARVDHTSDARSGHYALNVKLQPNGQDWVLYTASNNLDVNNVPAGYYSLSAWVKSPNASGTVKAEVKMTDNTVYTATVTPTGTWQQITVDNIYVGGGVTFETYRGGYNICLIFDVDTTTQAATNIVVDDITLKPLEFLSNSDFEKETLTGWKTEATGVAVGEVSADTASGEKVYKAILPAADDKVTLTEVSLPKSDFPVGYYMFAFKMKGSGNVTAKTTYSGFTQQTYAATDEWQTKVIKDIPIADGKVDSLQFIFENTEGQTGAVVCIDDVQFYRQIGPGGVIDNLSAYVQDGELVLPKVADGYEVNVHSSSDESIIALDGTVGRFKEPKSAEISLLVININDETDKAITDTFTVDVPVYVPVNPNNLVGNASFETAENPGFESVSIQRGQGQNIVNGWRGHTYTAGMWPISHTTDSHEGQYAIKFGSDAAFSSVLNMYVSEENLDVSRIVYGKYKLSVWVKGTNTASKLFFGTKTVDIPASESWQQITLDNIVLSGSGDLTLGASDSRKWYSNFGVRVNYEEGTELIVDDICLELTETLQPVVADPNNLFGNASFEDAAERGNGYEDFASLSGQFQSLATGWYNWSWHGTGAQMNTLVSHTTDAHSGTFALEFANNPAATDGNYTFTVATDNINTSKLSEGLYKMSVWVKGNAQTAKLGFNSNTDTYDKSVTLTMSESEWTKITLEDIYIKNTDDFVKYTSDKHSTEMTRSFYISIPYEAGTYFIIDDISLELVRSYSPVVQNANNIFGNASFEDATANGFETVRIRRGQGSEILTGWRGFSWDAEGDRTISHTTDSHTGSYALKFASDYGDYVTLYPDTANVTTSKLKNGDYRLSVWVKGTNTASELFFGDKKVTIPASDTWQQIVIDNVAFAGESALTSNNNEGRWSWYTNFGITVPYEEGKYIIIDDISLELVRSYQPAIVTEGNLISNNANFEADAVALKELVGSGQNQQVVTGWHGNAYSSATSAIGYKASVSEDANSGKYSLRLDANTSQGGTYKLFPTAASIDSSAITTGKYTLSVWVKGTVEGAKLLYYKDGGTGSGATVTAEVAIPASNSWQQITLYDIQLTDNHTFTTDSSEKGPDLITNFALYVPYEAGKYIMVDDFALTRRDFFFNGDMEIAGTKTSGNHTTRQRQPNQILQDFSHIDWSSGATKNVFEFVTGTDNVYSGNQALKLTNNSSSLDLHVRHDGTELATGKYEFSVWVKGNGKARIGYTKTWNGADPANPGSSVTKEETTLVATSEWQQIKVTFDLWNGEHLRRWAEQNNVGYQTGLYFGVNGSTAGNYVIFDNAELKKIS